MRMASGWSLLPRLVLLTLLSATSEAFAFTSLRTSTEAARTSVSSCVTFPWQRVSASFSSRDGGKICRYLASGNDDSVDEVEDDEEEEDPLANGIESVTWLPSVKDRQSAEKPADSEILPMFPLGGIVYTPQSNHVLNIFEPRYRQMYNDILMNGSKRFVVTMCHPTERGTFAQIGVVFQLEDLKEVSEMTADRVKYICDHRVTDRVKVHRILNPEAWDSRDTYLKVEATRLKDEEAEPEAPKNPMDIYLQVAAAASGGSVDTEDEKGLRKSFSKLVQLQHDLQEDVRFTKASVNTLKVKPGSGKDSLWETVRLWQAYSDNRLQARQADLQKEFQEKLLKFLRDEKKLKEEEIPSAIDFSSLSPELQKDVQNLQKRMSMELQPLILESTLALQKILEAETHKERVKIVKFFVDAECRRLKAKNVLLGIFTEGSSLVEEVEKEVADEQSGNGGSMFFDEPDAFQ